MTSVADWMLDDLPVGVWVGTVPDGRVAYTNRAFREILGMDAVAWSVVEDVPATYHVRDRAGNPFPVGELPYSRVVAERRPLTVEGMVLHRADGSRVFLRAFAAPRFDDAGTLTHVVVSFIDITREIMVERERDTVGAQLELAIRHSPVVIWAADRDGVITLSEGAGLAALGVASGALVGQNVFTLYGQHPTIPGYIRRGLAGESFSYTVEVGDAIYDTWITPLRDDDGVLIGVAALSNDVSDVRRLQARAVQTDRLNALGTLAASVAHEINNPLTYVMASADGLALQLGRLEHHLDRTAAGPDARALLEPMRGWLEPIKIGARRIATITGDLRTFSRADDDRLEPVDVVAAMQSALLFVRREIEANARLTVAVDLPPETRVLANEGRLVQVFLNLLTNAVQALSPGKPNEIAVRLRIERATVIAEVTDTGPGVPFELRARIFEPFVTTKEIGQGTGLGLFVCRNIVKAYAGEVEVDDRAGGGAVFRISLPVTQVTPAATCDPAPAPRQREDRRILVIDDEPLVSRALAAALTSAGYRAVALGDASAALDLLVGSDDVALVYCDLMMSGVTGMELEARVRARAPAKADAFVFMTGGAFTAEAHAFVAGGKPRGGGGERRGEREAGAEGRGRRPGRARAPVGRRRCRPRRSTRPRPARPGRRRQRSKALRHGAAAAVSRDHAPATGR